MKPWLRTRRTAPEAVSNIFDNRRVTLRCAPGVVSTAQGDQTILCDFKRGMYYTLNDVGSRVWMLLANGATLDALIYAIQQEYAAPQNVIESDVSKLLADLRTACLIVSDA